MANKSMERLYKPSVRNGLKQKKRREKVCHLNDCIDFST
jgi:hypothetical protein